MKKIILILGLAILCLMSFSQETGTFEDPRDGKVYKTIKIGKLWIMAENLAYKPNSGNFWPYDNNENNVARFGYLYDWETAKKVVPAGWHIPTYNEWQIIIKLLGNDIKKVYEATKPGGSSGFNALLSGCRDINGVFGGLDKIANFWSSTATGIDGASSFDCYDLGIIATGGGNIKCGFSVRLIQGK